MDFIFIWLILFIISLFIAFVYKKLKNKKQSNNLTGLEDIPIIISKKIFQYYSQEQVLNFCANSYRNFLQSSGTRAEKSYMGFIYMYYTFTESNIEIDNQTDLSNFLKNGNIYISSHIKKETYKKIIDELSLDTPVENTSISETEGNIYFMGVGIITALEGGGWLQPCYISSL